MPQDLHRYHNLFNFSVSAQRMQIFSISLLLFLFQQMIFLSEELDSSLHIFSLFYSVYFFFISDFSPVSFDALVSFINHFLFFSSKTVLLGETVIISKCNLFLLFLLLREVDGFEEIIVKIEDKSAESYIANVSLCMFGY